jgi:hypothetical protein
MEAVIKVQKVLEEARKENKMNMYGSYGIVEIDGHQSTLYNSIRITLCGSVVRDEEDGTLYMLSQISADVITFITLNSTLPNGNRYNEGASFHNKRRLQEEANQLGRIGLQNATYLGNIASLISNGNIPIGE